MLNQSANNDVMISVRNVGKMYRLFERPKDRLKEQLFWRFGKRYSREFWALRDISFEVKKGEALGIIGKNGSGKSTLLQIIVGTQTPTVGEVQVNGRVAALLELGSGFNPDFTGRENVYLNGSILGFDREAMDNVFDEIAAFADIGQFMDQPVKHYSSGMFVRLAFAVQACVKPDILIVDEALSVGDIFFQHKCHQRMDELLKKGTTILLVSHDMSAVEKYSSEVLLLVNGECCFLGQPNEGVERYYQLERGLVPKNSENIDNKNNFEISTCEKFNEFNDWPTENTFLDISKSVTIAYSNSARCTKVAITDENGINKFLFEMGEKCNFYYEFEILKNIDVPVGGIIISNKMNIIVHGKNSLQLLKDAPLFLRKGERVQFKQTVELSLAPGDYLFEVNLATMEPQGYNRKEILNFPEIVSKLKEVIRLRNAGYFSIIMKTTGHCLPYHGIADLHGECFMNILN